MDTCRICFGRDNLCSGRVCACKGTQASICNGCIVKIACDNPSSSGWLYCPTCNTKYTPAAMTYMSREWVECIKQVHSASCRVRYLACTTYVKANACNVDEAFVCGVGVCVDSCYLCICTRIEVNASIVTASLLQGVADSVEGPLLDVSKDLLTLRNQPPCRPIASAFEAGAKMMARYEILLGTHDMNSAVQMQTISVCIHAQLTGRNSVPHLRARLVLYKIEQHARIHLGEG